MSIDTVLRIKRKRTDDPVRMLLASSEDVAPSGKKRRMWQLSRSSDSRGIPVPISTYAGPSVALDVAPTSSDMASPPRFSVRKRASADMMYQRKSQRIIDLERDSKPIGSVAPPVASEDLETNEHLSSMLREYLSANHIGNQDGSHQEEEEDYVYDIYYPKAVTDAIDGATEALLSNYGLLNQFDWTSSDNVLVVDEDDKSHNPGSDEDSNSENYAGNDYPDESDFEGTGSDNSLEFLGSGKDNDELYDCNDWD